MTAQARIELPDWPRLMSIDMAAAYLGIGTTMLRERGPKPCNIGKRVVYDRNALDRWADAISGQPLDAGQREEEGSGLEQRVRDRLNG